MKLTIALAASQMESYLDRSWEAPRPNPSGLPLRSVIDQAMKLDDSGVPEGEREAQIYRAFAEDVCPDGNLLEITRHLDRNDWLAAAVGIAHEQRALTQARTPQGLSWTELRNAWANVQVGLRRATDFIAPFRVGVTRGDQVGRLLAMGKPIASSYQALDTFALWAGARFTSVSALLRCRGIRFRHCFEFVDAAGVHSRALILVDEHHQLFGLKVQAPKQRRRSPVQA